MRITCVKKLSYTPSDMDSPNATITDCPLYVDMDGTLVRSDTLWEAAAGLLGRRPIDALKLPLWLLGGRAKLKQELAERAMPDPALLPYRKEVLEFIKAQKAQGRRVILATASHEKIARAVADHLGLFDAVIASTGTINIKGDNKLNVIQEQCGQGGFDYIGNSRADLPLWGSARRAYLVGCGAGLQNKARARCKSAQVLDQPARQWQAILRELRPKQWIKNLLLFVSIFFAHQFMDLHKLFAVVWAFVAMCLCASAGYVLNDLLDLEKDRLHPRKRSRPFAAGALSIPTGIVMFIALLALGFAVALGLVNVPFAILLGLYVIIATAYAAYFKAKLVLDVIVLAGLYAHRILAGGAAAMTDPWASPWLLAFSLFFFMSLAFVKRYSELAGLKQTGGLRPAGRGYLTTDLDMLANIGLNSGYMAVMVFCLYINSETVQKHYDHPAFLWCVSPILLYWITRLWIIARRGNLLDDPVLFALTDRVSLIAAALSVVLVLLAFMDRLNLPVLHWTR